MAFGNVKAEDFAPVTYSIDTSAAAVYLFDVGSVYFHEDASTHYEEVYQKHTRIRIMNKSAFGLATIIIPLLDVDEDEQKIEDLQATTYNISNGKVTVQPVNKNAIYKEKYKGVKVIKLALPDVKEGSIIEYSYTIKTPGIGIPGWSFQGAYPRLWSQYEVIIPYFYDYAVLKQGNPVFKIDSTFSYHTEYSYHAYKPDEDNTLQRIWVMQNVPAIAPEPFTNTIENNVANVEFQLSAYKNQAGKYVAYDRNWFNVTMRLMRNIAFGYDMINENKRVNDIVKEATGNTTQDIDKAKNIYKYVRDHFTCTDHDSKYLSQEMKKTIQSKQGNSADINLLLIAMLMNANLVASPVLLSTVDNGKINYEYPVLSKYNYVVCQLIIDKKQYFLDASYKYLPFSKLPGECYNGYARVINPLNSQGIYLSPNSLNESINTTVLISAKDSKAMVTTSLSAQPTIEVKKQLGAISKEEEIKRIKALLLNEANVNNVSIHGLSDADTNIAVKYEVPLDFGSEDVIYFTPLLNAQIKSNPFVAATRKYQIELPYCKEETFRLTMEIPDGYEVDELPSSSQIKLNENAGLFDYSINRNNNTIELNVKMKLTKAIYEPEEYQALRDFYKNIIKKEAEQIVFKKVK